MPETSDRSVFCKHLYIIAVYGGGFYLTSYRLLSNSCRSAKQLLSPNFISLMVSP